MSGRWKEVTPYIRDYSASRSTRSMDRFMILACAIFVFALCTNYTAAAQNPNLLEQMEGDFNELSNKAGSWSTYPASNTDTIAQDAYDIGLWSECACWELEPEDGYIEIIESVLPEGDIQLCIDQAYLDQFYVYVHVYGGYILTDTCLMFEQKGECYKVNVDWELIPGLCCSDYYYNLTLSLVCGEPFCFDANNWPQVDPPFRLFDSGEDDLQKKINAYFCSWWEGCPLDEQEFKIFKVHSSVVGVLSYVSPHSYAEVLMK